MAPVAVALMQALAGAAVQAALKAIGKLITPDMIQWVVLWGAKRLAAHTDTPYDDELIAKIEEALKAPTKEPAQ